MKPVKRWEPPWWVPYFLWSFAFGVRRFTLDVKDWPTFWRWCRELEKLIWVKLTGPSGSYSVKEIGPGEFEVKCWTSVPMSSERKEYYRKKYEAEKK